MPFQNKQKPTFFRKIINKNQTKTNQKHWIRYAPNTKGHSHSLRSFFSSSSRVNFGIFDYGFFWVEWLSWLRLSRVDWESHLFELSANDDYVIVKQVLLCVVCVFCVWWFHFFLFGFAKVFKVFVLSNFLCVSFFRKETCCIFECVNSF